MGGMGGEIACQFKRDLPCAGWCHPLRRSGIMVTRKLFGFEARAKGNWCARRDYSSGSVGGSSFFAFFRLMLIAEASRLFLRWEA